MDGVPSPSSEEEATSTSARSEIFKQLGIEDTLKIVFENGSSGLLSQPFKLSVTSKLDFPAAVHEDWVSKDFSDFVPPTLSLAPQVFSEVKDRIQKFALECQRYERLKFFAQKNRAAIDDLRCKFGDIGLPKDDIAWLLTRTAEENGWFNNLPSPSSFLAMEDDCVGDKDIRDAYGETELLSVQHSVTSPSSSGENYASPCNEGEAMLVLIQPRTSGSPILQSPLQRQPSNHEPEEISRSPHYDHSYSAILDKVLDNSDNAVEKRSESGVGDSNTTVSQAPIEVEDDEVDIVVRTLVNVSTSSLAEQEQHEETDGENVTISSAEDMEPENNAVLDATEWELQEKIPPRIDEFTSLSDVFINGFDGNLTCAYRQTAMKILKISADFPETFRDFDFSTAIPPVFRDDEPISASIRRSLLIYGNSMQRDQRVLTVIREAAPMIRPILEQGSWPSKVVLRKFYSEVLKNLPWGQQAPNMRTIVRRSTHTHLLKVCTMDESSMPLKTPSVIMRKRNETAGSSEKCLKKLAEDALNTPRMTRNMSKAEKPPTLPTPPKLLISENFEPGLEPEDCLDDEDYIRNCPKDGFDDGSWQAASGTSHYQSNKIPYTLQMVKMESAGGDISTFSARPHRSFNEGMAIEREDTDEVNNFSGRRDSVDEEVGKGTIVKSFRKGEVEWKVEDFTQLSHVYRTVIVRSRRKKLLRKDFRKAMLKWLNVTVDNPASVSEFDVTPAIPPFLSPGTDAYRGLEKQIIKSVRECQRLERAKLVYRLAFRELGIQSKAGCSEEQLDAALTRITLSKKWTSNVPGVAYIKYQSQHLHFDELLPERSVPLAKKKSSSLPNTSSTSRNPFLSGKRNRSMEEEDVDVVTTEADEIGATEIEEARRAIARMRSLSELYKGGSESSLKGDYRQLARIALNVNIDHPASFTNFDFSPAVPPFVQNDADESATLRKLLLHTMKHYQRDLRALFVIHEAGLGLQPFMEMLSSGQRPDNSVLRPIFEREMKNHVYAENGPLISRVLDRATVNSMTGAVQDALVLKNSTPLHGTIARKKELAKMDFQRRIVQKNSSPLVSQIFARKKVSKSPRRSDSVKNAESARVIDAFASLEQIYKNGKDGTLLDSYRRSAIHVLGITADYPDGYIDFDLSLAVPSFLLNNALECSKLKNKVRQAAIAYQIYARAKQVLNSARSALSRIRKEGEDGGREQMKAVLEAEISEKRWVYHKPSVNYMLSLMRTDERSSEDNVNEEIKGFTKISQVFRNASISNSLAEKYRAVALKVLGITTESPADFNNFSYDSVIPGFLRRDINTLETLKRKLRISAMTYQRSLRTQYIYCVASPVIMAARRNGSHIGDEELKAIFADLLEQNQWKFFSPTVASLMKGFSMKNLSKYYSDWERMRPADSSASSLIAGHSKMEQKFSRSSLTLAIPAAGTLRTKEATLNARIKIELPTHNDLEPIPRDQTPAHRTRSAAARKRKANSLASLFIDETLNSESDGSDLHRSCEARSAQNTPNSLVTSDVRPSYPQPVAPTSVNVRPAQATEGIEADVIMLSDEEEENHGEIEIIPASPQSSTNAQIGNTRHVEPPVTVNSEMRTYRTELRSPAADGRGTEYYDQPGPSRSCSVTNLPQAAGRSTVKAEKEDHELLERLASKIGAASQEKIAWMMAKVQEKVNRQIAEDMLKMTSSLSREQRKNILESVLRDE